MSAPKIFKTKYAFDQEGLNNIIVKWKQGLMEFEIYHNDVLLKALKGNNEIRKGVFLFSEQGGSIFVKMVLNPMGFEVKAGDRYLFNSRILSEEKLSTVSSIFYFVGVISTLFSFGLLAFSLDIIERWQVFTTLTIYFSVSIFYFVAGALVRKGKIWVYFTGLILFAISTLLYMYSTGMSGLFIHIIRLLFLALIISQMKNMWDLYKHRSALNRVFSKGTSLEIIDDIDIQ